MSLVSGSLKDVGDLMEWLPAGRRGRCIREGICYQ